MAVLATVAVAAAFLLIAHAILRDAACPDSSGHPLFDTTQRKEKR